jgi:hypothetical protein
MVTCIPEHIQTTAGLAGMGPGVQDGRSLSNSIVKAQESLKGRGEDLSGGGGTLRNVKRYPPGLCSSFYESYMNARWTYQD